MASMPEKEMPESPAMGFNDWRGASHTLELIQVFRGKFFYIWVHALMWVGWNTVRAPGLLIVIASPQESPMTMLETLEERRMFAAWIPFDNADVAAHYPIRKMTTKLFLNFDGGTVDNSQSGGQKVVKAFVPPAGVDRESAIQDIIYRTQQIFSPFRVRVQIMRGAGKLQAFEGASTIFVGDMPAHVNAQNMNTARAFVPRPSMDNPGDVKGVDHIPNSNPYDVGFVDPVFEPTPGAALVTRPAADIARSIAHEAGHTFGLAHVLSLPAEDIMSYNSANKFFVNQSFPITDLNFDGTQNVPVPEFLVKVRATNADGSTFIHTVPTQNSFLYLKMALNLRDTAPDAYKPMVADTSMLDPQHYSFVGTPREITKSTTLTQTLSSHGEYDVYTLKNPSSLYDSVVAQPATRIQLKVGLPVFDPQIMLYSNDGKTLLKTVRASFLDYKLAPNTSYKLVIGGYLGDYAGQYTLSFADAPELLTDGGSSGGSTFTYQINMAALTTSTATFVQTSPKVFSTTSISTRTVAALWA
jgi:hypothetical protein